MQSEQRKQQGKPEEPEAEDHNDTDTDTK
jgi:hypothetical protein